jgi:phage terminase large subunit-like protein
MEVTPGDVVDLQHIRERVNVIASEYDLREVAFDRYGSLWLYPQLEEDGVTMVAMGQGYISMSPPTKELEARVLSRRLHHGGNPVLRWEANCLEVRTDPADNVKPVKPDRKTSRARIDGMVALIMALDRAVRNEDGPSGSVYDSRGIVSV